MDSKIK